MPTVARFGRIEGLMRGFSLLGLLLAACTYVGQQTYEQDIRDHDRDGIVGTRFGGEDCRDDDPAIGRCDADGDGFLAVAAGGDDCDDTDPSIYPGRTFYSDDDLDQYGDAGVTVEGCLPPPGYVPNDADCNDDDPNIHPGVQETCDPIDDNCDGDDYAGADASQWFYDRDGDGFGLDIGEEAACFPPPGQVANGLDCNDDDSDIWPGAPEIWYDGVAQDCDASGSDWDQDGDGQDLVGAPTGNATDCDDTDAEVGVGHVEACDGVDNDCDLLVDDEEPDIEQTGQLTWYQDADRDGAGDSNVIGYYCADGAPPGWALLGGDCRDDLSTVAPGATEVCNARDDDCNGLIDDGAIDQITVYEDADGDGFGGLSLLACEVLLDQTAIGGDCDDADPNTWPGAPEVCGDAERQDCSAFSPYDCDSDGADGVAWGGDDCDDTDPAVHVGGTETCNGVDDDCDELLDGDDPDVDPQSFPDWYLDLDADGYGVNVLVAASTCTPPAFTASNTLDCDDTRALVSPEAAEACNGRDDDCDGAIDEEATADVVTWYYDGDGDGAGDPLNTLVDQCIPPADEPWTDLGGDCDDADPTRGPLAPETCNAIDDNCDGLIDDEDPSISLNAPIWYADADGDGFGLESLVLAQCAQPADYAANAGDCNDFEPSVNPGAPELCNAGIDDDCDGLSDDADSDIGGSATWYRDGDGDGYGDAADPELQCQQPAGYVTNDGDCDDGDPSVSPAALEVCDAGVDDDCNGLADDDDAFALGDTLWYLDADHDGIGDANPIFACEPPLDGVAATGDCDDGDPAVSPLSAEVCNGADDDCDGLADDDDPSSVGIAWFADADGDGFGGPELALACDLSADGYVLTAGDCNDQVAGIFPGATEVCDHVDQDCDAAVDDGAVDQTGYLADGDRDGFGTGAPVFACDPPNGTVADPGVPALADCDDTRAVVWPGNPVETCDGLDNDCDGLADAADPDTATSGPSAFWDGDLDGFGAGAAVVCTEPYATLGYVAFAGDCDDADDDVNPLATERCNGRDDDCDALLDDADTAFSGGLTWYADLDGDGFGQYLDTAETCGAQPVGAWASFGGDCDDADPQAWPNGPIDCSGGGSSDACSLLPWFADGDGDGYGAADTMLTACVPPVGYVDNPFDCDDGVGGDVSGILVFDAAGLTAAVAAPGCPLAILATGFDDAVALDLPTGATAAITSEDPAQPAVLRQVAGAPVLEVSRPGSLAIGHLSLVGLDSTEMILVADADASLAALEISLDGGGVAQGLSITEGHATVARLWVRDTDAGGNEGSALQVQANGALTALDVDIYGATGASSVLLRPDGDDVSVDGLVARESDRIRVLGGVGAITLSRVESWRALDDGIVIDGLGTVATLTRVLAVQAAGDGVQVNTGSSTIAQLTVAGSGDDGVDGTGVTITNAIVVGSADSDLVGTATGLVYDHALFGTSTGAVTGTSAIVGDPAFVSYDVAEPYAMVDLHLRATSAALGAGIGGENLGYRMATEGWAADLDGNGLPDGWERRWFADTGAPAFDDPDLDGVRTLEELAAGTAPVRADTDADGANDGSDFAPLDPFAQ
jgi:hypothetical protein